MVRTGQDAIDAAEASIGPNVMSDSGLCLAFVRGNVYDVAAYYGSAVDAWYGAEDRHPGDRNPPPAVPAWFDSASPYEHVAFHSGGGRFVTTYNDDVRAYGMGDMEAIYGPYAGWAPSINEVTIWTEDDDMPTAQEVAEAVWGHQLHRPNGPVTDAGTYLVDTRVLAGSTDGPLQRTADQVWSTILARPNGPATDAGTYLVDTRASVAPVTAGPVLVSDQVWTAAPVTSALRSWPGTLALILGVALVVALVVALALDVSPEAIVAGTGVFVGGIVGWIASTLGAATSTPRHRGTP
jgi:hypothetical protein